MTGREQSKHCDFIFSKSILLVKILNYPATILWYESIMVTNSTMSFPPRLLRTACLIEIEVLWFMYANKKSKKRKNGRMCEQEMILIPFEKENSLPWYQESNNMSDQISSIFHFFFKTKRNQLQKNNLRIAQLYAESSWKHIQLR